jgi:hypothetical protein
MTSSLPLLHPVSIAADTAAAITAAAILLRLFIQLSSDFYVKTYLFAVADKMLKRIRRKTFPAWKVIFHAKLLVFAYSQSVIGEKMKLVYSAAARVFHYFQNVVSVEIGYNGNTDNNLVGI